MPTIHSPDLLCPMLISKQFSMRLIQQWIFAVLFIVPIHTSFAQDLKSQKASNTSNLIKVTQQLALDKKQIQKIEAEISLLKQDRAQITKALIETAKRTQILEGKLSDIEQQLVVLGEQETDIKSSLHERRGLLAEVLAALQRMGRKPPPALLVRPDDALASVRSAVLLGAVVPEMKAQTNILIADLQELSRLRATINTQQNQHAMHIKSLAEDNTRLSLLVEEKLKREGKSRSALIMQSKKVRQLGIEATSLKQLIATLDAQIKETDKAAKSARDAENAQQDAADKRLAMARSQLDKSDNQLTRLQPDLKFNQSRGRLQMPVQGVEVLSFGEQNSTGSRNQGAFLATRANALVISPVDARIVYAGPFRSYGKLLILDVGDDVYIVMAGMDQIDVRAGQFVLTGEPIAKMGTRRIASAATVDIASSRPMLYVEFRKDGKSFDPAPWWAENSIKRTGNDT
jgi:septal ring factor EnvC (AmiA/AmiB activator)